MQPYLKEFVVLSPEVPLRLRLIVVVALVFVGVTY